MVKDFLHQKPYWCVLACLFAVVCQFQTSLSAAKKGIEKSPATTNLTAGPRYKRVCYYTNWSQYRRDQGRFLPSDIDPFLCTHLIFAFAKVGTDGVLAPYEWNDLEHPFLYKQFTDLKQKNPRLRTLLGVGGWNHGSLPFTAMVSSKAGRSKFIAHAIKYLRNNRFDGLDLDWEYPASRGSPVQDKERFVTLTKELHDAFEKEAEKSEAERLLLTMAVPGGEKLTLAGYDVRKLNQYVDFFNLMSYDLHGGWSPTIGHHAPLIGGQSWTQPKATPETADKAVNLWLKLGADAEKLVMGLAFYGKTFKLCTKGHQAGNKSCGAGRPDNMPYYDILRKLRTKRLTRGWLAGEQVPYAVSERDRLWVGYDDQQSLLAKVSYVQKKRLGGVMVWSLDQDDFNGQFGGQGVKYPLMTTVRDALTGKLVNKTLPSYKKIPVQPEVFKQLYTDSNLKSKNIESKLEKVGKLVSRKERVAFEHPSVVPLLANLGDISDISHKSQSYFRKTKPSQVKKKNQGDSRASINRKHLGKKSTVEIVKDGVTNHSKGNLPSKGSNYSQKRVQVNAELAKLLPNKSVRNRDRGNHNMVHNDEMHDERDISRIKSSSTKYGHQRMAHSITKQASKEKSNKPRLSGRLVRGRLQRRFKRKKGPLVYKFKRNPIFHSMPLEQNHKLDSGFPEGLPFSVISLQTSPPEDFVNGSAVLGPWPYKKNLRFTDPKAGRISLFPTKTQSSVKISKVVHPFAHTFSASLNNNASIRTFNYNSRIPEKKASTDINGIHESKRRSDGVKTHTGSGLDNRNYLKNSKNEQAENRLRLGDIQNRVIVKEENVVRFHDPTYKWYEPMLSRQRKDDLDLKLAETLPYKVPWQVHDRDRAMLEYDTIKDNDKGAVALNPGKIPEVPFTGDKFVKVSAVPLSGLSLSDVVRDRQRKDAQEESRETSQQRREKALSKKYKPVLSYRSRTPWFSKIDGNTRSLNNTKNVVKLQTPKSEMYSAKMARGLGSKPVRHISSTATLPSYGSNETRLHFRRRRLKPGTRVFVPHRGEDKVLSGRQTGAFEKNRIYPQNRNQLRAYVEDDTIQQAKGTLVRRPLLSRINKQSLINSAHQKEVWWDVPKLEKYQAFNSSTVGLESSMSSLSKDTSPKETFTNITSTTTKPSPSSVLGDEDNETVHYQNSGGNNTCDINKNDTPECQEVINSDDVVKNKNGTAQMIHAQTNASSLMSSHNSGRVHKDMPKVRKSFEDHYGSNAAENVNSSIIVVSSNTISKLNKTCHECNATESYVLEYGQSQNVQSVDPPQTNHSLVDNTNNVQSRHGIRRKAGRRNPQPHAYNSLNVARSPFKPPPKVDTFYRPFSKNLTSKTNGRVKLKSAADKMTKVSVKSTSRKLRNLQKLRQLLQNSTVVEELKSKLDELHEKVKTTLKPFPKNVHFFSGNKSNNTPGFKETPPAPKLLERTKEVYWYEMSKANQSTAQPGSNFPSSPFKNPTIALNKQPSHPKTFPRSISKQGSQVLGMKSGQYDDNVNTHVSNNLHQQRTVIKPNLPYKQAKPASISVEQDKERTREERNFTGNIEKPWWEEGNNGHGYVGNGKLVDEPVTENTERINKSRQRGREDRSNYISSNHRIKGKEMHVKKDLKARRFGAKINSIKIIRHPRKSKSKVEEAPGRDLYRANNPISKRENSVLPILNKTKQRSNTSIGAYGLQNNLDSISAPRPTARVKSSMNNSTSASTKQRNIGPVKNPLKAERGTDKSKVRIPSALAGALATVQTEWLPLERDHWNVTARPIRVTDKGVTDADRKSKMSGYPSYQEADSYKADYTIVGGDSSMPDHKLRRFLMAGGQRGLTLLGNDVTPATFPGARLVSAKFNSGSFSCPSTFGIFRDPDNCRMFFQCVWFVAFHHICGEGTAWNDYDRICDWPVRTDC